MPRSAPNRRRSRRAPRSPRRARGRLRGEGSRCVAGACRSLWRHSASMCGIACPERLQHVRVDRRCDGRREDVLLVAVAVAVELARRPRAWRGRSPPRRAPIGTGPWRARGQLIATAGADRRTAGERERHVGAELPRQTQHVLARNPGRPTACRRRAGLRRRLPIPRPSRPSPARASRSRAGLRRCSRCGPRAGGPRGSRHWPRRWAPVRARRFPLTVTEKSSAG